MFLSIVTVVKDDLVGLQETRDSIEKQDWDGWEHVIVYAPSNDGSDDFAQALQDGRTAAIREEQHGIFSAMNLGLEAAQGRYVQFLNSGDVLYAPDSLSRVRASLTSELWGVGDFVIRAGSDARHFPAPCVSNPMDIARFRVRMCHPATIFDRMLLRNLGGYDTNVTIAADFDLMLRASLVTYPVPIAGTVAEFRRGGVSSQRPLASLHQANRVRRRVLGMEGGSRARDYAWSGYRIMRATLGVGLTSLTSGGGDPEQSVWRRRRL